MGMLGRTDRPGSLIGFQDPFQPARVVEYTVRGVSRCSMLSITRAQLKEVLTTHAEDRVTVLKAIEHAQNTLAPSKGRPGKGGAGGGGKGGGGDSRDSRFTQARYSSSDAGSEPLSPKAAANGDAPSPAAEGDAAGGGGGGGEIAELRREVAGLRGALAKQTELLTTLLQMQQGGGGGAAGGRLPAGAASDDELTMDEILSSTTSTKKK